MGKVKLSHQPLEESPYRKAPEACAWFQIGRNQLDKLAEAADAKIKISVRCVVYDIPRIEKYLRDEL